MGVRIEQMKRDSPESPESFTHTQGDRGESHGQVRWVSSLLWNKRKNCKELTSGMAWEVAFLSVLDGARSWKSVTNATNATNATNTTYAVTIAMSARSTQSTSNWTTTTTITLQGTGVGYNGRKPVCRWTKMQVVLCNYLRQKGTKHYHTAVDQLIWTWRSHRVPGSSLQPAKN